MPMSTRWPRPVRARASSAIAMPCAANMPLTMSAMATPSRNGGPSASPVMLISPPSAWIDRVVARLIAPRARLAEAGDRAVDQPRPSRPTTRLVAEPQPLHRAGTEVLDQHVGAIEQPLEDRRARRLLQVERQALLVAVDAEEVRALAADERRTPRARVVAAAGLLDLDDARAHVGEQHRAVRPGQHARQIDDEQAV